MICRYKDTKAYPVQLKLNKAKAPSSERERRLLIFPDKQGFRKNTQKEERK